MFFQVLTSVIAEFPSSNFISVSAVPKVHPLDRRLNKKYFNKHMFLLVLQVHEIIKRSFIVAMKVHSHDNSTFSYFN